MYLRQLQIKNLKLIRDLTLRFRPDPEAGAGMWTVLIGRNGRGKTSILRAIAAVASGKTDATTVADGWFQSLSDRRRADPPRTEIGGWFQLGSRRPDSDAIPSDALSFVSWLGYTSGDGGFVGRSKLHAKKLDGAAVDDLWLFEADAPRESPGWHDTEPGRSPLDEFIVEARRKNLDYLFVAAYGNQRALERPGSTMGRSGSRQRVASLFDLERRHRIMGLDHFEKLVNGRAERFKELLDGALFRSADLMYEITGLHLRKLVFDDSGVPDEIQQYQTYSATLDLPGGPIEVPTAWLADGQQALLSWLADLIGHLMLDQRDVTDPADFEGLVLVDDIDLHIHPDWQTRLVPALKRAFPKLQFIVTTHSPLIISSLRPEEVVVLDLDEAGNIQANPLDVDPRLLTTTELYERVFGVRNTPPDPIYRTLHHYEYLARDPVRSAEEEARMQALRAQLQAADVRNLAEPAPWTLEPDEP